MIEPADCGLPSFPGIIYMVAGPHSGYTLAEIIEMKMVEQSRLGRFYWGYGGSLCHPLRVHTFVDLCHRRFGLSPILVLGETRARYRSATVGRATQFSTDGRARERLPADVTMVGCTVGVVASGLERSNVPIDLNAYDVVRASGSVSPLGHYIRYRINKACATRRAGRGPAVGPRLVHVVATAKLVPPYCVYMHE